MKHCATCGATIEDEARFCESCGTACDQEIEEVVLCEVSEAETDDEMIVTEEVQPVIYDAAEETPVDDEKKSMLPLVLTVASVVLAIVGAVAAVLLLNNRFHFFGAPADDTTPTTAAKTDGTNTSFTASDGIVMTVNGVDIDDKIYKAMLYDEFSRIYYNQGLYQYEAYGIDVWSGENYPYGDENVTLEEYLRRRAKDSLIRQNVVQKLMKDYGITVDAKELADYEASLAGADERMAQLGFDKASYLKAGTAMLEETTLFYTLYGENGAKAVSAEELTEKYNENYKNCYIKAYAADGITDEQRAELNKILEQSKNTADKEAAFSSSANMLFNAATDDAALGEAIDSVAIGETAQVEYTDKNGTAYIAVIAREALSETMDESAVETCLYLLKFKEHDAQMKALMEEADVKCNDTLMSSITPKSFLPKTEEPEQSEQPDNPALDSVGTVTSVTATHYATIEIEDYGTIKVALDAKTAPITVANFKKLADAGFYNGLTFHRIIKDFMMQGGDPNGNGSGGSDEDIKGEFAQNGVENPLSHVRGAISMARGGHSMDSASSQFFIVHQDSKHLDGQYAAFGYVIEGMDVVDAVCTDAQPTDSNGTIPAEDQPVIKSLTVTEA